MAETRAHLAELDPVWARIRSEAEQAVIDEPLLGGLVHYSILHHPTLDRALSYRISLKLANPEMSEQILREICDEAYGADPALALGETDIIDDTTPELAPPSEQADLEEDFRHLGLSLARHPMALLREQAAMGRQGLARCLKATELAGLDHGHLVQVAGLVTTSQRPGTASGVTFVTLEDETGNVNVVVWKDTAKAQRQALLNARLLKVTGHLEREGSVIHVIAGRLEDLSGLWAELGVPSRDFR